MKRISKGDLALSPGKRALLERLIEAEDLDLSASMRIPLRREGSRACLSFAQRRLWFISQLTPESPAYNDHFALLLTGAMNTSLLQQAMNEIVSRHDTLRTTFSTVDQEPIQVVGAFGAIPISVAELVDLEPDCRKCLQQELAIREARRCFDLERGPLVRMSLLKLSRDEHLVLFTIHHLISDGWSLGILVGELTRLGQAFSSGSPSSLPPLPIQYGDYAEWQKKWVYDEIAGAQMPYWKKQMAAASSEPALPGEQPRSVGHDLEGAREALAIPPFLHKKLKAYSQQTGSTIFSVLSAVFKVLLYRYSGQADIVIGAAIAGRNRAEIEGLIGFFSNTLPLRSFLCRDASFADLLVRVTETAKSAFANQDLPFDLLVDELNPERGLNHSPLFQVMFVLQEGLRRTSLWPGITTEVVEIDSGTSKFDLTLDLIETSEGLHGAFEYSSSLFAAATMRRMARHFVSLLGGILENPKSRLCEFELLSGAEQQQIQIEWNDSKAQDHVAPFLHQMFEAQADGASDAVAVVSGTSALTYREVNEWANRLAHYLRSFGLGPEQTVALCLERGPELVIALLAVLKAGGAYVPMDPSYPVERLAYMLDDLGKASAPILLTQRSLRTKLSGALANCIELDRVWGEVETLPSTNPNSICCEANLAYLIYTSGSTGRPKGVALTHAGMRNLALAQRDIFGPLRGSTVLQFSSIGFDASTWEVVMALSAGAKLVLDVSGAALAGDRLHELLVGERVEVATIPPSVLASVSTVQTEALRTLVVAGEACSAALAHQWAIGRCMLDAYGPTETTVCATISKPLAPGEKPSIGRPISNTRVYVLDACGQLAAARMPGELLIGGISLARGYWDRPDLTAQQFVPDSFGGREGGRLYRTGDKVRWQPAGRLDYLGRLDDQVKVRGHRIELGEIESVLALHPGIEQCAVAANGDEILGKRLTAYVVTLQEAGPGSHELRQYLRERLPDHMVPSAFVNLSKLPLTANGKLDRKALDKIELVEEAPTNERPRTPIEELIANIWCDALQSESVGLDENFFDLGGHSLLATSIASRVRAVLQVDTPLRTLLENPTVAAFAAAVERERDEGRTANTLAIEPTERDGIAPLSLAQRRLWFIQQMEPESAAYNVPLAVRLLGNLDQLALQQCLRAIEMRHEVLRARFDMRDGEPVQIIGQPTAPVSIWDFMALADAERETEMLKAARRQASLPFDLGSGPPMSARLLQLTPAENVLLVTMHHIVTDGWSIGIMLDELRRLYEADRDGKPAQLPELRIQYSDFAIWQRESLRDDILEQQLGYWKRSLDGVSILELPADRRRPATGHKHGASRDYTLPVDVTEALRAVSRRESVTLFMTLLAGFQLLLSRYSGQRDIPVGTPIAGRNLEETKNLVGFFVNPVVMRTRIDGNASVKDLLANVRQVCLGAYSNQDVPFDRVVDALRQGRGAGRHALFEVMLGLQQDPADDLSAGDLAIEPITLETQSSIFDLSLLFDDDRSELKLRIEYSSDLYDPGTIDRTYRHLERVLAWVPGNSEAGLESLSLLADDEARQILFGWNDTATDYGPDLCLHQLIAAPVQRTPSAVAVVFDDLHLSYNGLDSYAGHFASALRALGAAPDSRVAVCLNRSAEMVVALLGVLKAGAAYLPIDPSLPRERVRFLIEDSGTDIVICERGLCELHEGVAAQVIHMDPASWPIRDDSDSESVSEVPGENAAYVMYTSGSTGLPKGVVSTHAGIVNRLRWMQRTFYLDPAAVVLQKTPFSFDVSVWELFWPLTVGAKLVVASPGGHRDPAYLADVINRERVSDIHFVPSMLRSFLQAPYVERCTTLNRIFCSGEALTFELVQGALSMLNVELHNLYGPTEASVEVSWFVCNGKESRSIPIGKPIGNLQLYVLDSYLQPVPPGVVGDLFIGGAGLARGYLGKPSLTADSFVPHPFAQVSGSRLYRTGDLARYLSNGDVEFLGRADHQVKIRGVRIELGEIESALNQHPQVRDTVVAARKYGAEDDRLIAYLAGDPDQRPANSTLRAYLKEKLPELMIPANFVWLQALPVNANGKVDRRALPDPEDVLPTGQRQHLAPRGPLEELLARIWRRVLGIQTVGADDDFFELGGHSLLLARLASQIRGELSVELPLKIMFENPTIGQLAVEIAAEQLRALDEAEADSILGEIQQLSASEIQLLLEAEKSSQAVWETRPTPLAPAPE
jgi:amino acid adenylation domain-containing protein